MKKQLAIVFCCFLLASAHSSGQWLDRRNDIPVWNIGWAIDAFDSNNAVIAADSVFRTTDGGAHWLSMHCPAVRLSNAPIDISMPDIADIWVATGTGSILHWNSSTDTWEVQFHDSSVTTLMNFVKMFDRQNGIAMGDALSNALPAVFLKTTDGGAHWLSVNDSLIGSFSGNVWQRLDFPSPQVGYYFESGKSPQKLYKTTDGCRHWQATALPDSLSCQMLTFADENIGLAYTSHYTKVGSTWIQNLNICRTRDGGSSWEIFPCPATGYGNNFCFMPNNPARVWLTDKLKLYFSSDTGRTWTEVFSQGGRDIAFTDSMHGWMLGDNGVLYYTSNAGGTATGVISTSSQVPVQFTLEQNYPNPFNPMTRIRYSVASLPAGQAGSQSSVGSNVRLTVYDLLGREVAMLVNEPMRTGRYEVTFTGTNLASGTYICRLTVGTHSQAISMVLIR
jgi:photosystem II stability/assembly factor-like uncharacterized protein